MSETIIAERAPWKAALVDRSTKLALIVWAWLKTLFSKLIEGPAPTLPSYTRQPASLPHKLKKAAFFTTIVIVGMMYGFMVSIFPTSFYVFMISPIVAISLIVIWILPETDNVLDKQVEWLFFAFFLSLLLWPNYLAIDPPGLPWITLIRIWSIPMVLLFLLSISMSPKFRARITEGFATSPWAKTCVIAFAAIQVLTWPLSKHIADSFNQLLNTQIEWIAVFFIACFVFMIPGRALLWAKMLCCIVVFWCFMAVWEYRLGRVPWADHIPSFLAIQDESVQAILRGGARSATGIYRIQGPFSTSLNLSEFMGLSVAFFVYFFIWIEKFFARVAILGILGFMWWVILRTDSRLGVVGFLCSMLIYLLLWSLQRRAKKADDLIGTAVVFGYPLVLAGFLMLSLFWQRLNHMIWGGGQHAASNAGRQEQYKDGITMILKWPIGNGIGQGADTLGSRNRVGTLTIDSYYLVIGLEYGILGMIAYFGFFISAALKSGRVGVGTTDRELGLLVPISVALTTYIIIKGVLAQEDIHAMFFMLAGMAVALLHRAKRANEPQSLIPGSAR